MNEWMNEKRFGLLSSGDVLFITHVCFQQRCRSIWKKEIRTVISDQENFPNRGVQRLRGGKEKGFLQIHVFLVSLFCTGKQKTCRWNHVFDCCSIIIFILKLLGTCRNTNNEKEFKFYMHFIAFHQSIVKCEQINWILCSLKKSGFVSHAASFSSLIFITIKYK
jgi:hypothetical protein